MGCHFCAFLMHACHKTRIRGKLCRPQRFGHCHLAWASAQKGDAGLLPQAARSLDSASRFSECLSRAQPALECLPCNRADLFTGNVPHPLFRRRRTRVWKTPRRQPKLCVLLSCIIDCFRRLSRNSPQVLCLDQDRSGWTSYFAESSNTEDEVGSSVSKPSRSERRRATSALQQLSVASSFDRVPLLYRSPEIQRSPQIRHAPFTGHALIRERRLARCTFPCSPLRNFSECEANGMSQA